jgi:hypothetical protein
MFDLFVAGKQYKVKDNFEEAMAVAKSGLLQDLKTGEKPFTTLAFTICTGLPAREAFEIVKNLNIYEYQALHEKMYIYCMCISDSQEERENFMKRLEDAKKKKSTETEIIAEDSGAKKKVRKPRKSST